MTNSAITEISIAAFDRDIILLNIKCQPESAFAMNGVRVPIATYGGSSRDEKLKSINWGVYQPHVQISIKHDESYCGHGVAPHLVRVRLFFYPVSYKYNQIDYISDVHTVIGNIAFRVANDIEKLGVHAIVGNPGQVQVNTRAYIELPLLSAQQRCVEKTITVNSPAQIQKKLLNLLRSSTLSTCLHPMLVHPAVHVKSIK